MEEGAVLAEADLLLAIVPTCPVPPIWVLIPVHVPVPVSTAVCAAV